MFDMEARETLKMTAEERRRELPGAIVKWYRIEQTSKVACVVTNQGNSGLVADALEGEGLHVDRLMLSEMDCEERHENAEAGIYDIVVAADVVERARDAGGVLGSIRRLLAPGGKLLLAADNRLGIRYFCGDQDAFSGKVYDSVEDYRHLLPWERERMEGRAYAKSELVKLLEGAGFARRRFFSVFPRISNPQLLLAEDYMPNEALDIRVFPEYNNPDTVFLCEEELYPSLAENGLLHGMANGFFVECPLEETAFSPINQVTLSGERGPGNALATILRSDGFVEKRALYREGAGRLQKLCHNNAYLSSHGVRMVPAKLENDLFVMPYMDGIPANDYFRDLLKQNKEAFLRQMDLFWDIILHSSEHADADTVNWEQFEPGWEKRKADDPGREKWRKLAQGTREEREALGAILKRGYLDLVSLNCFYVPGRSGSDWMNEAQSREHVGSSSSRDGGFVFYDQELYLENVPAKAILVRTIEFIYKFNDQLDAVLPRTKLLERYGLLEHMDLFQRFISSFLNTLRDDDGLSDYYKEGRRELKDVKENRNRMDYSEEEYPLIFKDIFHHIKGRRLYLFGAGKYAKRFLDKYGETYPVSGYLDNDKKRWGTEIDGLPVLSPAALKEMNPAEYKVMVCIMDYLPVVKQLKRMQIPNFSVYNPYLFYREPSVGSGFIPDSYKAGSMSADADMSAECSAHLPGKLSGGKISGGKKYNIGYVAGVFDLFHIGHLNLLRRAKEQCNYLIVGVVTDEGVIRHKKSKPQIPFLERLEIVRACRYVDKAVEIPLDQGDTDEAYRRYRFDAQFSGSDYADDPRWQAKRDFLQRHGADLVFFPYTEGVSTTQLKDKVNHREDAEA